VVSTRLNGVQYLMATQLDGKAKNILDRTATPVKGTGFEISEDPRPAAASRSRGQHDPLIQAMLTLKPGAHIRIDPKAIKKPSLQQKVHWAKKNGGNKGLAMYVAEDGRFIVYIGVGEKEKL